MQAGPTELVILTEASGAGTALPAEGGPKRAEGRAAESAGGPAGPAATAALDALRRLQGQLHEVKKEVTKVWEHPVSDKLFCEGMEEETVETGLITPRVKTAHVVEEDGAASENTPAAPHTDAKTPATPLEVNEAWLQMQEWQFRAPRRGSPGKGKGEGGMRSNEVGKDKAGELATAATPRCRAGAGGC